MIQELIRRCQSINLNIFEQKIIFQMKQDEQTMRDSLLTQNTQLDDKHTVDKSIAKQNTVNGTGIFQKIFFTWVSPLLSHGSKQQVTVQIMPNLPPTLKTQYQYNLLHNNFQNAAKSSIQGWCLSKVILTTFLCQFLKIFCMAFIIISLSLFNPFLTSKIIEYIQNRSDYETSYGITLFIIIILTSLFRSIFQTQMYYALTQIGINLTNSLTMMIYCKSFKYASITEKKFSESDIINFSQVDSERMTDLGFQLASLLVTPIQIIGGIVLMYWFIGISFLSGIGVMLLTILITFFLSKFMVRYNNGILKTKDQRMKVTQQMLDIIRYIKINAIEKFFYQKIDSKRVQQVKMYKKRGIVFVLSIFVYWLSCPLILSATFITYIALGHQINSTVAFTTIMIFSNLQYPIRLFPTAIQQLIQIYSSIKRIEKYLFTEQIKTDHFVSDYNQQSPFAIKIERGNFYWGVEKSKEDKQKTQKTQKKQKQTKSIVNQEEVLTQQADRQSITQQQYQTEADFQQSLSRIQQALLQNTKQKNQQQQKPKYVRCLKDINTTINKGKFTLLIGDIGSGKSSFLLAILNEMRSSSQTKVQINGQFAYCSQKPWIMSGTVKQNILFELPFQKDKFNKVIHFASLQHDIKILPKGVQTQIGEKGVNLSGGQKTRISLARALYSEQDIYLLDDVLSAVDVHVGDFLMRQTLLGYLQGKTILMPTHALKFAEFADELIIMKKGRIVRKGHFKDICQTEEFQQIYLKQKNKKDRSESEQQKQQQKIENQLAMLRDVIKHKQNSTKQTKKETLADKLVEEMMLPEDHETGNVDFKIFREYINLNGGILRFAVSVCCAMFFWFLFMTFSSIVMERWCQNPIGQNYDLYIYIGLSVLSNIFIFIRAYILIMSGAKQGQAVHRSMIKALLYASLGKFYNRVPIGRIVNRLTKDLRQIDQNIGVAIGSFLVYVFQLIGTLAISIYGSTPYILIPIVLVGYLSHRVRRYYMKTQRQVARYQKSTNSPIVSGFMSSISGLSTIRAYQKQQQFITKQIIKTDQNKKVRLNKAGLQSWFSINLTYLSFFVNLVAIGYCVLSNNQNGSLAGLLMNYAVNLSEDIIGVTSTFATFQTKIISLQRIYNFMQIEPEQAYTQYCIDWNPKEEGYREIVTKGSIQFVNMHVKYRQDLPDVLIGLNCKIQPGQKIGIVGRTGAGKTTIINTILRTTEISQGSLLIDGTSLQNYSLKDLRNAITMIDQEPTLIKSTFKENLDITGRYTDEELISILKQCNLYETISKKGGLEGNVSNDSLSAGEKQLLCICRAFLKNSKIVLIDQATANIDMKNDQIIQRVISEKFKDCTVLTIAHRLSTLKNSDKIIVMQSGRIVQFGTPFELQNKASGFYRQMILKNAKEFLQ